jgi:hypothetical protein
MKRLILTIIGFIFCTVINAQTEYGALNQGKYSFGLTLRYNGNFDVGANFTYRSFNSLFSRPMNFSTDFLIGIGGKNTNPNHTVSFGLFQVYANSNSAVIPKNGFGIGSGLYVEYLSTSGLGESEPQFNLKYTISPGYYANTITVAPKFETNIINYKKSETGYLTDIGVGLRGDYIPNRVGLTGYSVYHLNKNKPEPADEPDTEGEIRVDTRFGLSINF